MLALVQALCHEFPKESAVGDQAPTSFTKVHVGNAHGTSLIDLEGHLIVEGDQIIQTGPAFHKCMLAGPDHLAVL